jgi:hypothetical protein
VRFWQRTQHIRHRACPVHNGVASASWQLKKAGRSRDETVAVRPTTAFDAKWGNFVVDPGYFTRLVYEGV